MKRESLANWLKGAIVFIGIIGLLFFTKMVPDTINGFGREFPEFGYLVFPSIVAIFIGAVPIYIALFTFWKICSRIAKDNSFCHENTVSLILIGKCAVFDTIYCFGYTVFSTTVNAINPATMLISLGTMAVGVVIAIAAFLISHLVEKAVVIQEENELTV